MRSPNGRKSFRHGLVDEDVAVGQEQHPAHLPRLPQPPDDLEGGVRLAGARRHHQEQPVFSLGDVLDSSVHRHTLVITRRLPVNLFVVVLEHYILVLFIQPLPLPVSAP
jgi:hypothetical protein